MTRNTTEEFKKVSQAEIDQAVKRAHEMRSEFAFESVKSLLNWIKGQTQPATHVQGGSKLAHSA